MSPEELIIGCVLNAEGRVLSSNSSALVHQANLRPEDFRDMRLRGVWGAILRMAERRRPANTDTLFAWGQSVRLFAPKDIVWLRALEDNACMLDRGTFGDLVDGLRRSSRAQQLANALEAAVSKLRAENPDIAGVVEQLEAQQRDAVASVAEESSTGDMSLANLADRWARVEEGHERPDIVPTGIEALDALVGGFYGNLNMVIGAPSEGKSAFIGTVIELLLQRGLTVGLFGLEDGDEWVQRRHVAKRMGIPARDVGRKPRTHEQHAAFADATEDLAPLMSRLLTFRRGGISTSKLLQVAEGWRQRGCNIIFVDHGGELDHHSEKVDENRLRVGISYRRMRDFATATGIPMVVVAHTRRKNDHDTEPRPPRADEVRDSSDIENAARLMLGVWQLPGEDFVRISSAKVTEGERGKTVRIPKVAGGVLLDAARAEVVDLFAERMAALKAKKEARDRERAEAKARLQAEKEKSKPRQRGLGLGDA